MKCWKSEKKPPQILRDFSRRAYLNRITEEALSAKALRDSLLLATGRAIPRDEVLPIRLLIRVHDQADNLREPLDSRCRSSPYIRRTEHESEAVDDRRNTSE